MRQTLRQGCTAARMEQRTFVSLFGLFDYTTCQQRQHVARRVILGSLTFSTFFAALMRPSMPPNTIFLLGRWSCSFIEMLTVQHKSLSPAKGTCSSVLLILSYCFLEFLLSQRRR